MLSRPILNASGSARLGICLESWNEPRIEHAKNHKITDYDKRMHACRYDRKLKALKVSEHGIMLLRLCLLQIPVDVFIDIFWAAANYLFQRYSWKAGNVMLLFCRRENFCQSYEFALNRHDCLKRKFLHVLRQQRRFCVDWCCVYSMVVIMQAT